MMSLREIKTELNKLRIDITDADSCKNLNKITDEEYNARLKGIHTRLCVLEKSMPKKKERKKWCCKWF